MIIPAINATIALTRGPPGALILSNKEEIARKISETTFPFLVATPYCNKFASLAVTLAELLKHADNFAEQIVSNAKTLGEALYSEGIDVLCRDKGYTESHMLMMDIREYGSGEDVERELAEAHIISNKMPLPGDRWDQKSGIRIGVNEVTRRGMKAPEMQQIASIIGDILVEDKSPADVADDVISLMSGFQEVKYTL